MPGVWHYHAAITKVNVFVSGLTDEEVQMAILRSSTTEEVLPLTPTTLPQPVQAAQLVPVLHSESQSHLLLRNHHIIIIIIIIRIITINWTLFSTNQTDVLQI